MRSREFIVVGLGNPGPKYARHRHNLGFMVVDRLAGINRSTWQRSPARALLCRVDIDGYDLTLVKPQTYMNQSGKGVAPLVARSGIDLSHLVVVHDDLDLAPGRIRMKIGGGDGGHKGIRSLADSLRSRDFLRVRMGIGRPPEGEDAAEFVLKPFLGENDPDPDDFARRGCTAVELLITHGLEDAQNLLYSRIGAPGDKSERR